MSREKIVFLDTVPFINFFVGIFWEDYKYNN